MSERSKGHIDLSDLLFAIVLIMALVTAIGVSHQSQIRELQRRVGQLESERR